MPTGMGQDGTTPIRSALCSGGPGALRWKRCPLVSLRPRLELAFLAGLALAGLVICVSCQPEGDPDVWWHLAAGRWILDHRQVPKADPFSYSAADAPWTAHEWAAEVLLYWLYRTLGLYGLSLYRQFVAAAGAVLLYGLCLRVAVHPLLAFAAGAAFIATVAPTFNARPQLLLPIFTLLLLHLFLSHRQGRRRVLWWLVPLAVVWVNFHGGFLLLFVLTAFYAVSVALVPPTGGLRSPGWSFAPARALPIGAAGAGAALATFLNPNGLRGVLYPFAYFTGDLGGATRYVNEFLSPNFSHSNMIVPLLLIVGLAVSWALSPRAPDLFELLAVAFCTASFLRWQRMIAVFGAVSLWVIAQAIQARFGWRYNPSEGRGAAAMNLSIVLLALLMAVAGLPWTRPETALIKQSAYPEGAVRMAKLNGVRGRLLNTYHFGGYLIWRYYGQRVVFIDGRADVYAGPVLRDYMTLSLGKPGWQTMLRRYDFNWAVLDRDDELCERLRLLPDWHVLYADSVAVLFVRDGPANRDVLVRWRKGALRQPPPAPLAAPPCGD